MTGNTAIDAVIQHLPIAEKKSAIMQKIPFKTFALATAHRAENVDDLSVLESFMEVFSKSPIPIVYPMHPRTRKRLQENIMLDQMEALKNLLILPPLGYLDFLVLMKNCKLIITDSGGIQEEATAPSIRKPVLVIRLSTERQEAVESGFAKVVGTDSEKILAAMEETIKNKLELPSASPFGDGTAAQKIVDVIRRVLLKICKWFFCLLLCVFVQLAKLVFLQFAADGSPLFLPVQFPHSTSQVQVEVESGF